MKRHKPASKKYAPISGARRARQHHARVEPVSRRAVILRDESTCYLCHRRLGRDEVVLDHVIPVVRKGPHSEGNLRVACIPCNLRKGDKLLSECEWLHRSDGTLIMNKTPDKDAPTNPFLATTIANLVTQSQLHWLEIAALSVGMSKEETSLALFSCPVNSLSRDAARQLEQYFAKVKMNAWQSREHEHECIACGESFPCTQSQCNASLSRACDGCKADLFGTGGEAA